MKIGVVSDSLAKLPLGEMLDQVVQLGMSGVEVNTGGWSTAPHFDLDAMLASAQTRREFRQEFQSRGLEIVALNANGNPLHPTDATQADCLHDTIRVAGELGVRTVCTMSGLPAGGPGDRLPNWVVVSWPPEVQETLNYQWNDVLFPFWRDTVSLARQCGVEQIALELCGHQCVYNVPTLMMLRSEVGPTVGANLDPSHLFWMGADPLASIAALKDAIQHVHIKDTLLNQRVQPTMGLLDNGAIADVAGRSWSYVTPGFGHTEGWWRSFVYELRMVGYDGWLSVEHEDFLVANVEGLRTTMDMFRKFLPVAPSDFSLQQI
ncbi:sugar phosphate isomerase/epimerase [Rhizobium sp. LjRoot30]|uniref:sugar phosphate isomerase/epimerase family protein n=1 Tax=Rhizobium sp. LjRoot30 TaxID=3342320 RepID=UPI003ECF827A